ncbi:MULTISPECIES: helix-turn-helix domain-containing protein [unclassified Streptomyces]|uniref:Helix-turn-helix domain-containing protein n=1 Tax=Streptomyces sp. NBC_00060 TaxID=2975636 RepID=A0AAU2GT60_9ACTN
MPTTATDSAWRKVPRPQVRRFAELALAEVPDLARSILRQIRREYPGLPLTLDESGEPLALVGIRRALEQFVGSMTDGLDPHRELPYVFQEFGRGQVLSGRSLDSLQAIYRLGVKLAWRRLAELGDKVGIPAPAMYEVAESVFEYLDGIVAETMRGYAEAVARQASERMRLQRQLLDQLLTESPRADRSTALAERCARIGWPLPHRVAVAVLLRPAREALAPAVGQDVLLDMEREQPRMVVPEPDAAGRSELLRRATAGWSGALGPSVPLAQAPKSLRWAATAVQLIERGLLPGGEVIQCTDYTEMLILLPAEELLGDLDRRRLAPLLTCGPAQARHLAETLLAWLETRGGATEIAARLGVHPQTVRYRLRQIRELWGDEVADPDRRFELELVLRARRLRGELGSPPE